MPMHGRAAVGDSRQQGPPGTDIQPIEKTPVRVVDAKLTMVADLSPRAHEVEMAKASADVTASENDRAAREREAQAAEKVADLTHSEPERIRSRRWIKTSVIITLAILLIDTAAYFKCDVAGFSDALKYSIVALACAWGGPPLAQAIRGKLPL